MVTELRLTAGNLHMKPDIELDHGRQKRWSCQPLGPLIPRCYYVYVNFRWYVWGWAEYDDVFSGTSRHRTEFCFEVKATRDPHTNEIYVAFPMHKRFNAADWNTLRPYNGHENKYG